MPEGITVESLLNNIKETLADGVSKKKSVSFSKEEISKSVSTQFSKLFGRQKPVHNLLGGGKFADVLLWRNKKISAGVLGVVTAVWVLFERSQSKPPHLVLPDELFVNIGKSIGAEVNQALGFLQDLACGGNINQFLAVLASLWATAMIGSWCNFLTVLYIGETSCYFL